MAKLALRVRLVPEDEHHALAAQIMAADAQTLRTLIEAEPAATAESLRGTLLGKALQDAGVLCPA